MLINSSGSEKLRSSIRLIRQQAPVAPHSDFARIALHTAFPSLGIQASDFGRIDLHASSATGARPGPRRFHCQELMESKLRISATSNFDAPSSRNPTYNPSFGFRPQQTSAPASSPRRRCIPESNSTAIFFMFFTIKPSSYPPPLSRTPSLLSPR